jgi:nitrate reductase gamma subunit
MSDIVMGPLVWLAFAVLLVGSAYRIVTLLIRAKRDKVIYPYWDRRAALKSLLHWLIPFNSVNMRNRPVFTAISFGFHACLLVTPVLLLSHNILWRDAFGFGWPCLPEKLADFMTLMVILAGFFLIARRMAAPEVRNVTTWTDYLIIAIVMGPFVTGYMAYHQWFAHETMVIIHVISGVLWLVAIPFTRLAHILYFFFTRTYMASEFGFRNAKDW